MKLIFIAAPFRAPTDWQRAENVRRAEQAALQVWKLGAVAVCPQANSQHFQDECSDAVFLAGGLALLARCDAVYLAGHVSEGVAAELAAATVPILRDIESVRRWLGPQGLPPLHVDDTPKNRPPSVDTPAPRVAPTPGNRNEGVAHLRSVVEIEAPPVSSEARTTSATCGPLSSRWSVELGNAVIPEQAARAFEFLLVRFAGG